MSNDEAIQYLEGLKERYELSYEEDALNVAISAIQTIECIKCSSAFTNRQKSAIAEMLKETK